MPIKEDKLDKSNGDSLEIKETILEVKRNVILQLFDTLFVDKMRSCI
jgi:hypothetical protein